MKSIQHGPRICAGTLMGRELYRTEDEHGVIIVTQRGDKRVLGFGTGLEQSCVFMSRPGYLAHEYTQIMLLGLIFVEAKNITLLGLGGGGLAHCLAYHCAQINTRVVELRQAVIDIACHWFDLPRVSHLDVICADAFEYLKAMEPAGCELILSDLYGAHGMSEVQGQQDFIENSYRALSEHGCLVLNFHELPGEDTEVLRCLRALFNEIIVCDVFKGNRVVFCMKRSSEFDQGELSQRARRLAKQVDMPLMYYFRQLRSLGL